MKIKSFSFKNYKAFAQEQRIEIKPITVLIGKNSSGKSSIAKLLTLLEKSFSEKIDEPLRMSNDNVSLGSNFRDLVFNKTPNDPIQFSVTLGNNKELKVSVVRESRTAPKLRIYSWEYDDVRYDYLNEGENYKTNKDDEVKIKFKGFIPIEIYNKDGKNIIDDLRLDKPTLDVDYIGPFRILPERAFVLTGQLNFANTGTKGENAYSMLVVSKLLETNLYKDVGKWFQEHFDGWGLEVHNKAEPFIQIRLIKDSEEINIVDVGQGMNQALPLIVRSYIERPNSIIVIEQPELHLHPEAHSELVELFAKSAKKNNQSFLIETHSENVLLRLRKLVVDNDFGLTKDDVIIYWITSSDVGQRADEITINEEGVLSDWPEGVFTENVKEVIEMRKALKKKKETNDSIN